MKPLNLWFVFADEDLQLAEMAMKAEIFNQVCFHAQQGVEKFLKGTLHKKGKTIPKTHSLAELLRHCLKIDEQLLSFEDDCFRLDRFYIPTRYPDALPGSLPDGLPNEADAQQALDILLRIRKRLSPNA